LLTLYFHIFCYIKKGHINWFIGTFRGPIALSFQHHVHLLVQQMLQRLSNCPRNKPVPLNMFLTLCGLKFFVLFSSYFREKIQKEIMVRYQWVNTEPISILYLESFPKILLTLYRCGAIFG